MVMEPQKKKRGAENELNHDNWDKEDDEEKEERGEFKRASEETLQERKITKPKRRLTSGVTDEKKSNPFTGFGGFGKSDAIKPSTLGKPDTKALPQFGNSLFKSNPLKNPPLEEEKSESNDAVPNFWTKTSNNNIDFFASRGKDKNSIAESKNTIETEKLSSNTEKTGVDSTTDKYLEELSALNISVLSWIKKHVDENPCIDLTPVFKDYENHFKDLEAKHKPSGANKSENGKPSNLIAPNSTPSSVASTFGVKPSSILAASTPIIPKAESTKPSVQFPSNYFSSTPFPSTQPTKDAPPVATSTQNNPSKEATTTEEGEAAEVVNPEPERKVIEEKDAFHQIRCKLFFKKGAQFQELGIGMLYLKPNGENIQLLIRMESVTGKVLLNICVSKDTPMSRSGKNNVMVVSVPNPPVYTKPNEGDNSQPCTYLVRVKGTTEADELLKKLKDGNIN